MSLVYTFTSIPGLLLVLRLVCRCDQFGPMPPICPDHLGRIVCACVRACVRVCFTHTHTNEIDLGRPRPRRSHAERCAGLCLHVSPYYAHARNTNADACTRVCKRRRVHTRARARARSLTHTQRHLHTHTHTNTHLQHRQCPTPLWTQLQ